MTFAAQDSSTNFWLKWNLVVLPAVVADDLKAFAHLITFGGLFRTAFRAPLRRHHIALVKDLLFLFGEQESFFTLNARGFDVRHMLISLLCEYKYG